jgi:CheY-like chemotaxis protein
MDASFFSRPKCRAHDPRRVAVSDRIEDPIQVGKDVQAIYRRVGAKSCQIWTVASSHEVRIGETMLRDSKPWHGGRILVAEDKYLFAETVCDFVRESGLEPVGPVATVAKASELARERALDGALLDVRLGAGLSFPVCRILAARQIPFIFLTGSSDTSIIPLEFRGAPLLGKPFEPGEMQSALAAMLGRSGGPRFGIAAGFTVGKD